MRFSLPALCRCFGLAVLIGGSKVAAAGAISVRVTDLEGAAVPEVAIVAKALTTLADQGAVVGPRSIPEMNQHDLAFHPHVLVVTVGTTVRFPNDDDVRHHVYSFSDAKRFDMTIDSGATNVKELVFDRPGLVTLGCNIHDDMLAYVLVVETEHFGKTDSTGSVQLQNLPAGSYELSIWTPRLAAKHLPASSIVEFEVGQTIEREFRLERKLYPAHQHSDTSLLWRAY